MAFIKIVNSGYKRPDDMNKLINYIVDKPKHQTDGLFGGNMILTGSVPYVYKQMMDVKKYYGKTDGYMMRHMVVSLSTYEIQFISSNQLYIIGTQICNLFPEYQSVFCINLETNQMHIHFAINTVSFIDGRKLQLGPANQIRKLINNIISAYLPSIPLNGLGRQESVVIGGFDEISV